MALVTTGELLRAAQKGAYAVGAFNIENMEMALAVVRAAEALDAPVILQTTPSTVRYSSLSAFVGMVAGIAKGVKIPVALHLDHGESFGMAVAAVREGYTSVMIDGSARPFSENLLLSTSVAAVGAAAGVPVEAELGTVGGKEDSLTAAGGSYTDPKKAAEFVEKSGVTSLAVAIGTAHGFYSGTPVLDIERLCEIRGAVSVPLVLHGASGLSGEVVRTCIREGICKVNFATELRAAFTAGVQAALEAEPGVYDPKKLGKRARERVEAVVRERILICGSQGKAAAV